MGPLKCSNSLYKLGKECETSREHLYKYKNIVHFPILTMVDDTLAISECGQKSVAMNEFINNQIDMGCGAVDGKNISSLKNRVSRGIGVISQIIHLIEKVSFYFQIFSVLKNFEVWYGLTNSEIEELESLDRFS